MYSELELKTVKEHKVWGFVAYLQGAFINLPKLDSDISKRHYPKKEHVTKMLDRMNRRKIEFDIEYDELSRATENPLQLEQKAWELLSPRVEDHLSRFRQFIDSYSPELITDESREDFLNLTREEWDLVQKWNIISKSYNPKYEMAIYPKTGLTEKDIREKEGLVQVLIQELSQ